MPSKGPETANTKVNSEAEKTKLTNSADNKGETQNVIEQTTGELSDVRDNVVETKIDTLSTKVDAPVDKKVDAPVDKETATPILVTSDANTDRPTRKELRQEKKDLRKERRDDEKLDRLIGRVNKEIAKTSVAKQELNKTTGEYNLLMMNLEDLRNFNDYLMKVRNKKIDPATEKFQPQNLESFLAMLTQMPHGRGYIEFVAKDGKRARVGGSSIEYGVVPLAVQSSRKSGGLQFQNIDTSDDATFGEAYTEHGIRGLVKKSFDYFPNMTENQKDGWTNALFLGGMGYGLFKLGKRFFTGAKDKDGKQVGPGFLGRLAIAGGVFLGSNMLTGKSPIELIDKAINGGMSREYLKGQWGEAADKASETARERVVYPVNVTRLFGRTKIAELGVVLSDDFKIKNYDILLQKAQAEKDQDSLDLLQKIGKEDKDNQIRKGLEAMGITPDNYKNFGDKTVEEVYALYNKNISKAEAFRKEKSLLITEDTEKRKEYDKLISSGKEITDDDLKNLVETGVLYEQVEIKKDINWEQFKEKINKLEDGKKLKIKVDGEDCEIYKNPATDNKPTIEGEFIIKSKDGKTTKINIETPSIVGLGTLGYNDRKIVDKDNHNDYYSTISIAHKLNKIKNGYESRISASGAKPFEFTDGKIRFNETKDGGGINKLNVMDDGYIGGLFSDFPAAFKNQEENLVNYLNNKDNLKEINIKEQGIRDIIKDLDKSKNIKIKFIENPTDQKIIGIESHGYTCAIDIDQMMIKELPNRRFKNHLELIGAANLINVFKEILKNKPAQSTENPIYIGLDGNVAFNDRNLYEEMKSIRNRGADGIGDIDVVKSGDLTFRKNNSLKSISPTLYDHRVEFLRYLNKNGTFSENISESTERTKLKEKVNNLQNTDKLMVQIGDDTIELQKNGGLSSVNVISSEGKITTVNFENATIKGLGFTTGTTVVDRKFTDSDGHNNYLELLVTANGLNNIKNKYEDRIYAAGLSAPGKNPGFKYESKDKKIYFNESKEGGGIIKDAAMDDGIFFSDFPESFKGQENQIVTYLNNQVVINPESPDRVLEYFKSRGMDIILTNPAGPTTEVESYGYSTTIDLKNKKLDTLGRQFTNHLELIGAANLVNLVSKILEDRNALAKDGVYIGFDGNIAFDDKTIWEEIKTYSNKGLNGYGDVDLIRAGDLLFRQKNTLRSISPTLAANRREFVNYLNNNRTYSLETRQLQEKKARIEKALNNGMRNPITFTDGGMEYDEESKELTITAINEDSVSNDQMVNNNLGNIENFVSRYNILQSEDVKKIILPNINLEPGNSVSIKYLKKLLDLDEKKIQLGPDFLANREMIKVVSKKYDEGKFQKEENSKIDMNGIITLNYIYDNGYDFNRLIDGEDDSRVDFAMRVMELLAGHRTIVDPTKKSIVELDKTIVKTPIKLPAGDDPIMKIRRVSKGENVDFGLSQNKRWRKNADNIDIMNKIIGNIHRYATQNPPIENVPYIQPA